MKKYIFIISIIIALIFTGCEGKKPGKQEQDISKKEANLNQPEMTTLKEQTSDNKIIKKETKIKVTLIELGSVRCIPCKMMMPILKEIEDNYGNEVKVIFYDVWTDEGRPYAEKYNVRAIPTQVFLDENGKEFFRHVGFFPKEQIFEVLQKKGVNIK